MEIRNGGTSRTIATVIRTASTTVALLLWSASASATHEPHGAHAPAPRIVAVTGQAHVSTVPDRARVTLGVTQLSADVATAETAVNKVVKAYVAEARKLGSRDEDITTAGLSIQPEYVWDEAARNNKLTGYRVSRDIEVRVTRLDRLGDYLLAGTRAGVNQAQPPVLESSRADELRNQALVLAAKNAQAKAALLAGTLGVKLGNVLSINEDGGGSPPVPMVKAMAMRADAAPEGNAEMGLQTGEIRYQASVSAQFEMLP